ncbi:MAG: LytR/AlgR family response regulator transcription factor [Runella sp.]
MIRALIIDDEPESIDVLEIELNHYCPEVKVIGKCYSAEEGLIQITTTKPDLVFLDISMPFMSGFELLEKLNDIDFDVVFVTAYDDFALTAFEFCALDYLLKPVAGDRLLKTIERLKKNQKKYFNKQLLDFLSTTIYGAGQIPKTIAFPTLHGVDFIKTDEILYAEADGAYIHVFLTNQKKIFISKTLKEFERLVENLNFIRIHHSYIVNLKFIKKYIRGEGGTIVLSDGTSLQVSRANKMKVLSLIKML